MSQTTSQPAAARPLSLEERALLDHFAKAESWQRAEVIDVVAAFIDELAQFRPDLAPTHYRVEAEVEPDRVLMKVAPKHLKQRRRPLSR